MPLLTTADKTLIAADMVSLFPETCTIQRATNTTDGLGGRTQAWTTASTTTCRIMPVTRNTGAEASVGGAIRNEQSYRVAMPATTDILITDRISTNGLTLAVQQVYAPRSLEIERVAMCERASS